MAIEFKHRTLPNGLHVIGEIDPEAHSAAVGFFVKTGARDEASAVMGVSHFLEHMMFKGSAKRTAEEVDRDFDDIGAVHNAYTSNELTAFYAHTLPEHLGTATEILADIMRPALRTQDFDDEKSVVLEEIAMYDDNPFWVLYERAMESYYRDHPLSHRVLGTRETISALTRDQMAGYFEQRYSADNTVVAAAGRLDFDRLADEVGRLCAGWQTTKPQRTYDPFALADDDLTIRLDSVTQHYLLMLAPAPALEDDRRYAAAVLGQVLGDVDGSRLYWALVDSGLADEAQAQYHGRDGLGEYLVYCSSSVDNAADVEGRAREEIDWLIDSVDEDDLERVRNKIATGATLQGERPAGRMRRLGEVWTYHGRYRSLDEELAHINSVTLDDLRATHEAFPVRPRLAARLLPAS